MSAFSETSPIVPFDMPLRVVGDVHGDVHGFRHAVETDRFVIQLGDLADHGPDSAGALKLALRMLEDRRGLFLLGNHDRKLGRALLGRKMRPDPALEATLSQLGDPSFRERVLAEVARAPAWARRGRLFFVHGGFPPAMLGRRPPAGLERVDHILSRALFGEVTGGTQPDGYPVRLISWVDRIPSGLTVYCGHDRRSVDGRPMVMHGRRGGTAVFVDTGAGKGGHLSWIDLPAVDVPPDELGREDPPSDGQEAGLLPTR